jgi:phosphinothricin acetyltransferase
MIDIRIEAMQAGDAEVILAIYSEGIASGNATFETRVPVWDDWNRAHRPDCRLVARSNGEVIGWAALTPVSGRCVYAGVAEVSVYVAAAASGQGVGKMLLAALVEASEAAGLWTLQAGIFPENAASIAIHKACGFREVGYRERPGQLHGVWRDVLLLERRSRVVGIPKETYG